MFVTRTLALFIAVAALAASPSLAVTARFDAGGTVVQPGFDLINNAGVGTSGAVGVAVTAVGAGVVLDNRDRSAGENAGGAEAAMWRDFLFALNSNVPGEGLDVNITGLAPLTTYSIRVWSFDDTSNGGRGATWNGNQLSFGTAPDPDALNDYTTIFNVKTDAGGNALVQGRVILDNAQPHHVFINGLEIGDPGVPAFELPAAKTPREWRIDIDTTDGGTPLHTSAGFTSLNATTGNGSAVTVDGVTFTVFSADGSRNRAEGGLGTPNDLTVDFVFDDGAGQAVGVLVSGLPDGLYDVMVWAWDDLVLDTGAQIVGITQFASAPETIFTTNFIPDPTLPFIFRFNTADLVLRNGFGIFTRENSTLDRSRFNAIVIRAVTPEPATALLGLMGLLGLGARRRRA